MVLIFRSSNAWATGFLRAAQLHQVPCGIKGHRDTEHFVAGAGRAGEPLEVARPPKEFAGRGLGQGRGAARTGPEPVRY